MTLSNIIKNDKETIRWFILHLSGHEGPYSLGQIREKLASKQITENVKIWTEGMRDPLTLRTVLAEVNEHIEHPTAEAEIVHELEETPPPIPQEEYTEIMDTKNNKNRFLLLGLVCLILIIVMSSILVKTGETFSVSRRPKMSLEVYKKITDPELFSFTSWNREIFFKEFVAEDYSRIWLVTASYYQCDVEAHLSSIKDRLLIKNELDGVEFVTNGKLENHIVEFSDFKFKKGKKLIPGMYEMNIEAKNCSWDGLRANLANIFKTPEESYIARTKVILYSKGSEGYFEVMKKWVEKKFLLENKKAQNEVYFYKDLEQKLQTLLAVTSQVEQLFIDFINLDARLFHQNLPVMVQNYSKNQGSFFTSFVLANEKDFKALNAGDFKDMEGKKKFESIIQDLTKNVGLESMRVIEKFQNYKGKVWRKDLEKDKVSILKTFSRLKEKINQNLIQISLELNPP